MIIETERLFLRSWQKSDLETFALINQDPRVMEYFPSLLTVEQTQILMEKFNAHIARYGFGLWACCLQQTDELIGFVGLNVPDFTAPFTPCVEVGWRLGSAHWKKGYATEAAKKVLELGFKNHAIKEIVAFTVPQNLPSIRVMERIGMTHDRAGDFYHPKIPKNHQLCLHVLYRIGNLPL